MQNIITFFISAIFVVAIVYMILRSILKYRDSHHVYLTKNSEEAQKAYDASHKKESIMMSMKEKLELSWQFLYDITNIVLSKFSQKDKDEVLAMGHILLENGGRYEHVIDYGIRQESVARDPNKAKAQVR